MKRLTPVKAIRAKCLDCMGRPSLVRNCSDKNCPLFPYRMGKNPNRKGIGPKNSLILSKSSSRVGENDLKN